VPLAAADAAFISDGGLVGWAFGPRRYRANRTVQLAAQEWLIAIGAVPPGGPAAP
jgi:hypothetical protein